MIIKTSTFPHGPAKRQDPANVVQRILPNGRFVDTYVHELMDGDEYFVPHVTCDPLITMIEDLKLTIERTTDVDGFEVSSTIWGGEHGEVEYFSTSQMYEGWLFDALNFIKDQEDQA